MRAQIFVKAAKGAGSLAAAPRFCSWRGRLRLSRLLAVARIKGSRKAGSLRGHQVRCRLLQFTRSAPRRLWSCRETDGGLEGIAAGFAFPQMPHAERVDIFRPFGRE